MLQRFRPNTGRESLDKLFQDFFGDFSNPSTSLWTYDPFGVRASGSFPIDVKEESDKLIVSADLPGISSDNLTVEVEKDILKITAEVNESETNDSETYHYKEMRVSSVKRSIRLPYVVDTDATTSTYRDGVLEIVLPKVEQSTVKQITIN